MEGVTFGVLNGLRLILQDRPVGTIQLIGGGTRSKEWRQMIADVTGSLIQVPVEDEAGCLGAAIQAIYACDHQHGRKTSFAELSRHLVKVDATKTAAAVPERFELYRAALDRYNAVLAKQYPNP